MFLLISHVQKLAPYAPNGSFCVVQGKNLLLGLTIRTNEQGEVLGITRLETILTVATPTQ